MMRRPSCAPCRASGTALLSAAVIWNEGAPVWRHVGQVRLQMRPVSDDYIDDYVSRNWDSIRHAVGCYKLEEEGVRLFSHIDGDYFTVLGLPLVELLGYLTQRGVLAGMSDRKIPLAGVIGSPIAHSRSPALHMYWLRRYGIQGHYVPMDVAQNDLADVIQAMPKMGFVGVNVTIPHKEKVLALADLVTDRAALIGAANTLIFRKDGKIHADNTDGYGFIENLRSGAADWAPKSGPAAVFRCRWCCACRIGLTDRRRRARDPAVEPDPRPGRCLAKRIWRQGEGVRLGAGRQHAGRRADGGQRKLPRYDRQAGIPGAPGCACRQRRWSPIWSIRRLKPHFWHMPRTSGCTVVDGLGMLIYQAVPAFERWFGIRPEVDDDVRRVVLGV